MARELAASIGSYRGEDLSWVPSTHSQTPVTPAPGGWGYLWLTVGGERQRQREEWLTGCGPTNPTTRRIQDLVSPWGWMSQLILSAQQHHEEVASTTHEGMDFLARGKASTQRAKVSFFRGLYTGRHQKVWATWKDPPSKDPFQRLGLLISTDLVKKTHSQVYPASWVLVNSRCNQVDNQK